MAIKSNKMKYWEVKFSQCFPDIWEVPDGVDVNQLINDYVQRQNAGEAKSDRIRLKSKEEVTEEYFYKTYPWRNQTK